MIKNQEQLNKAMRCLPKHSLRQSRLISHKQANQLADIFKILANETRLRLLHSLVRMGEMCVTDLAKALAMKPQAVSNQLQRLADRGILEFRRNGLQNYYRITDPCTVSLLDYGWCLMKCSSMRASGRGQKKRTVV